jgi:hypothetical protein
MPISQELDRHSRDWVFAVGDAGKEIQRAVSQICKLFVSNLNKFWERAKGEMGRARLKMHLTRGNP